MDNRFPSNLTKKEFNNRCDRGAAAAADRLGKYTCSPLGERSIPAGVATAVVLPTS
jgi:hypothetical protein